jgi:thiol-disulfide isomerase/thioredoxin
VLASNVQLQEAGNTEYQNDHMGKIFKQGFSFSGFERDKLYRNEAGKKFTDISGLSGIDAVGDGRGAAYGDFDNDGDPDVFLTSLQGQVHHLFRNEVGSDNGYIRLSLEGRASGHDAYGAVVRLTTSHGTLSRLKSGGSGFVSQSDPRLLFGIGTDQQADSLAVQWPSGAVQHFGPVAANTSWHLVEGGALEPVAEKAFSLPAPTGTATALLAGIAAKPGTAFPPVTLHGMDGNRSNFGAYRRDGTAYLVNLWATYCVPCRREMPQLKRLAADLADQDVEVVGISLDQPEQRRQVERFVRRMEIDYPIFTSDKDLYSQLFSGDRVAIPLSFTVDRSGQISGVFAGWSERTDKQVRALLTAPE